MRKGPLIATVAVLAFGAGTAAASMWQSYHPSKAIWDVTEVRVEPTNLDDYLDGLRQTWVPNEELAKQTNGLIDYKILVNKTLDGSGPNVLLLEEYSSWDALAPNRADESQGRLEQLKSPSKDKQDAIAANFPKWRKLVDEGLYWSVEFDR